MASVPRARLAHHQLGTYFGIFMSAFVSLALLSLIFEGLGVAPATMRTLMFVGPIVLFATIGIASFTRDHLDYFTCGRRVSAFFSGLVLAMSAIGATGVLGFTGAFFLIGFDALCLTTGGLAGFVVMAVLLAPFIRKYGAFTVPSYLGRRCDSRLVRLVAAGALAVPMLLIIAAELRMGAYAAGRLLPLSPPVLVAILALALVIIVVPGGMRSLTWAGVAQSLAGLIAIIVPITVVAIALTNLPLPQLSYGPVMRTIGRGEALLGLPIVLPPSLAFDMPGLELQPLVKRFSDPMGNVGPLAFIIAVLTTMAGIASAPWLLPRVAATPGVYEARKALGWATVLFGLVVLTLAPAAVFMRAYLIEIFSAPGDARIPEWINGLIATQAAGIEANAERLQLSNLLFARDSVLLSLPMAAGLPEAAVQLVAAGVIALALAAAGASVNALGNIISEDVVHGLSWDPPPQDSRLMVARVGLAAAALGGAAIAIVAQGDPLQLLLWALALSGSAAFPVLVLSIWWKRLNAFGAMAGIASGFGVAVLAIMAGEGGWMGVEGALAGAFGIPAAALAAILVSYLTPAPTRHVAEVVRDIRVPGGEIIYDREMRLLRRKASMRS